MHNPARILIVDDDPVIQKATRRVLEDAGYETLSAQDGEEAIQAIHEHKPDLVLMDMNMPRMDGLEALRRVRSDPEIARTLMASASTWHTPASSSKHSNTCTARTSFLVQASAWLRCSASSSGMAGVCGLKPKLIEGLLFSSLLEIPYDKFE